MLDRSAPAGALTFPPIDDALWEGRLVPLVERLVRAGWFSFDVEGAAHVPRDGRAVFAANHAGWFPLDAFFLGLALRRVLGPCRTPHFATAESALAIPGLGTFLRRVGAVPAGSFRRPERLPPDLGACAIFPEGVPGNTKPFWHAYRMRAWSRGFVRVAAGLERPVVPVAILGGEECLPVAWTVRLLEPWVGSAFGLPLAPVPLPARWRVVFHPPVRLGPDRHALLAGGERSRAVAAEVRGMVQRTLDRRTGERPVARVAAWWEGGWGRGRPAADDPARERLTPAPRRGEASSA